MCDNRSVLKNTIRTHIAFFSTLSYFAIPLTFPFPFACSWVTPFLDLVFLKWSGFSVSTRATSIPVSHHFAIDQTTVHSLNSSCPSANFCNHKPHTFYMKASCWSERGFCFKKSPWLLSWVVNELFQLSNQKPKTSTFLHASNLQKHVVEFEYKTTTVVSASLWDIVAFTVSTAYYQGPLVRQWTLYLIQEREGSTQVLFCSLHCKAWLPSLGSQMESRHRM